MQSQVIPYSFDSASITLIKLLLNHRIEAFLEFHPLLVISVYSPKDGESPPGQAGSLNCFNTRRWERLRVVCLRDDPVRVNGCDAALLK